MLQIKTFVTGVEDDANSFLKTIVPTSIVFDKGFTCIVFDDETPINSIQRKNALRMQIGKQEELIMQAEINVALSDKASKEAKDVQSKETKQAVKDQHEGNKQNLRKEKDILFALNNLYASL